MAYALYHTILCQLCPASALPVHDMRRHTGVSLAGSRKGVPMFYDSAMCVCVCVHDSVAVALRAGTRVQGLGRGTGQAPRGTSQAPSRGAGEGWLHREAAPGSVRYSRGSCRMNARKQPKASIFRYEKDLFWQIRFLILHLGQCSLNAPA